MDLEEQPQERSLEEAQTLIKSGFEYVTDIKIGEMTYKLFRKKKPWRPS